MSRITEQLAEHRTDTMLINLQLEELQEKCVLHENNILLLDLLLSENSITPGRRIEIENAIIENDEMLSSLDPVT